MRLKGTVALVTGASRGIGSAIARALAREGAAVGVHFFTHRAEAEAIVEAIQGSGGNALAIPADLRRADDVKRMVDRCQAALGSIDILVNNARSLEKGKPFLELSWADYENQIEVMLQGAFHCCQAILPSMVERRKGRVVNILSAVIGERRPRTSAYGTVKSALLYFSQNLAAEMGPFGITVNMVSPGLIRTERPFLHSSQYQEEYVRQTPMGRLGCPEDVAEAVVFLAGEGAAFISGANVPVCGGKVMF